MTSTHPPPPVGPTGPPAGQRPPSAPGATPDPWTVLVALYRLLGRGAATRGRLVAIGALSAVSVITALAVHASSPDDPLDAGVGFVTGNLSSLVPVGVLVFAVATLGDLQDDGSLVYLWLRPIPTRLHVLAAWAAAVTITVPLVGLPIVLSAAIIEPDGGLMCGAALSVLVGIVAYSALFVTAGIRFRRALPWGLVYILIWEGFVASAGETASRLAIRSYVRSILSDLTGMPVKLAEFNLASGIIVPLVVAALVLVYAARRLARTDIA